MTKLQEINELSYLKAKELFSICCGSEEWIEKMINSRPFNSKDEALKIAETHWYLLDKVCWLDAFSHHPKIGDINSLGKKYSSSGNLAKSEQSRISGASMKVLENLSRYNEEYERKFGYIFIVCASGKSAEEMLSLIEKRINNTEDSEIKIAMEEQNKITKLRLEKFL